MKGKKLARITAKLLALTMSMSLFTAFPAVNAVAEESGAATITVYDSTGSQVGD